ncbi:MAG: hypothetical protein ACTSWN_07945 [Promethearchaeota archaeon]
MAPEKKSNENLIDYLGAGKYMIIYGIPAITALILVNIFIIPNARITRFINPPLNLFFGLVLLSIGFLLWGITIRRMSSFLKAGELCTDGIYAHFRHPLYLQ